MDVDTKASIPSQFPTELLLYFFGFADWRSLNALSQVCREWRSLVLSIKHRPTWMSAFSTKDSFSSALAEIRASLKSARVEKLVSHRNVGFLFATESYLRPELTEVSLEELANDLPPSTKLIGAVATGVIGTKEDGCPIEVESGPAVSFSLGNAPNVECQPFYVAVKQIPNTLTRKDKADETGIVRELIESDGVCSGLRGRSWSAFVLIAQSLPRVYRLMQKMQKDYPNALVVGGIAPRETRLFFLDSHDPSTDPMSDSNSQSPQRGRRKLYAHKDGMVGMAFKCLTDALPLVTAVSNGYMGLEPLMRIDTVREGWITEVRNAHTQTPVGRPYEVVSSLLRNDFSVAPVAALSDLLSPPEGRNLYRIESIDQENGGMLLCDVNGLEGKYLQLCTLTPTTARQDADHRVRSLLGATPSDSMAALAFACAGRGLDMFEMPNADSTIVRKSFPKASIVGMFCQGELGPTVLLDTAPGFSPTNNVGTSVLQGFTTVYTVLRVSPSLTTNPNV